MSLLELVKATVLTVALSTIIACSPQAEEQKAAFVKGVDFEVVRDIPSEKPEITEHFSLYCGHCYNAEPMMHALKATLNKDVSFNRSHVLFLPQERPEWGKTMTFAVASANRLNIEDKFVDAIFNIHFEQKKYIGEYIEIQEVFTKLGVNAATLQATINEEETLDAVRSMVNRASADKVRSTPDVVVNGKYRVLLRQLQESAKKNSITPQQQLNELVAYLLVNPQ
jgi:thiol:disulfide interchange protein DsbA